MSQGDAQYGFVQLDRTFRELPISAVENDDIPLPQPLLFGKQLTWADLTQEFRTIILSEAGTGKTEEIRQIAAALREQNKPAFFLRLEYIPAASEVALEVGSNDEFEAWLRSDSDGWIFLDSVDEARLRDPGDFELAIRKVGKRIAPALQRAHITITGRGSAWRPKTDLDLCIKHLPYTRPSVRALDDDNLEDEGPNVELHTEDQPEQAPSFKIVTLNDLGPDQIRIFTDARGVKDTKAFVEAVERADAWSFAERPQDLTELAEFWCDHERIGSRLEIMQNSIARRLAERDQRRADARPLSQQRANEGAKLIAAAVTMVQEAAIRVPDGADNSKGIAVGAILTDWDDRDCATLLSRPIFDEAIYGAVRFHHRSVREFLTAEWLAGLLKRETSRWKIEALLFRKQYGLDVIVPTMRPILPWLAILDEKVLQRILKIAPEVLLEGGDPSRLPVETRRQVLHQVCREIASGASSRSATNYAAVQRFANDDLVADVRELIGNYITNDELTSFLLRMVWQGEMKDALPEAKNFALSPSSSKYTRLAAFRAVRAVGSSADIEEVRTSFLRECAELERDLLAELLDDIDPAAPTPSWVLECLAKAKAKEPYRVDGLTDAVVAYVQRVNVDQLPQLVQGLNGLLDEPPVYERRYCEISEQFGWLMAAAAHGAERLIEARDPAALKTDVLAILHKLPSWRERDVGRYRKREFQFPTLVPAWSELNRASFWYEAGKAREGLDKKCNERLSEFYQVPMNQAFWRFHESDFDYALTQISERSMPEEKQLALSLAFDLYVLGGRGRKRRETLKRTVAAEPALAARLAIYLRPPAKGRQSWKRSEARWKRRIEAQRRKEAQDREDWRIHVRAHVAELRDYGLSKPGSISRLQWYVHERVREKEEQSGRWASGNWRSLIEEFGEEAARAYRDSVVRFWRLYEPRLRSEGAPTNKTPFPIIFGLTGLQIEANETRGWPEGLSQAEVELACRYASHELNGFPLWFPTLFAAHPSIVGDFLLNEIRYELSIEKADVDGHYILDDVSWSGEWAWNDLAPAVCAMLKKEPKNLSNLAHMLAIVQGSSVTDAEIAKLASRKCKTLKRMEHAAQWFAVWMGVDPETALPALLGRFDEVAQPEENTLFAMRFITYLLGSRSGRSSKVRSGFRSPAHLKILYLLTHKHIRAKEDVDRIGGGAYTPGLRDEAQDARRILGELLRNSPGKDAFLALLEIEKAHPEEAQRSWFALHAKSRAELDADIQPWSPGQLRDFHDRLECTPGNHRELAELACERLLDLKDDLENGDSSIAETLRRARTEPEMRKFVGRELRLKAFSRYNIPQEEELADAKKPDLRFHGVSFDGPVPAELKLADKWTGPELFERLENQLCGDYLRDSRSKRGIFLLVCRAPRQWELPTSGERVDFGGLLRALEQHWTSLDPKFPEVDDVAIIGIDLTRRDAPRE